MNSLLYLLCSLAGVYSLLMAVDHLLEYNLGQRYRAAVQSLGLEVGFMRISWRTQALNRLVFRLGNLRPRLLRLWFIVGAYVSSLLLIPAMVLLVRNLVTSLVGGGSGGGPEDGGGQPQLLLQPVLPGVNLPLSNLGYYFATLMLCSIIHEAGHMLAAVREDVRTLGFGIFVVFVLPAAHVDLPTSQLLALRKCQQLRVFAAGIWHNIVLAALAYLLVFSLPTLSSPFYTKGVGVVVMAVEHGAAVRGPTGLVPGDVIVAVNDVEVLNRHDWISSIVRSLAEPSLSVCMSSDLIDQHVVIEESNNCCAPDVRASSSLCFVDVREGGVDVGTDAALDRAKSAAPGTRAPACLPVRTVLEKSGGVNCNVSVACTTSTNNNNPSNDREDETSRVFCMQPVLEGNVSRLLQVRRSGKMDFLFVGSPAEVYQTVRVSDYVPASSLLPAGLPDMLELLALYVASFSGALAVLNVVPCYMLDGQHIIRVLADIVFPCYADNIRAVIACTFTVVGSVLLVLNICVGVYGLL